ncbi:SH3 domain-containing protein [Chlamydoabsidia padenii]|nr:SH3 domain-containing protein [Chlamydoabsidia padenii]
MTDPHIMPFAKHMLSSIQKDLILLKDHHVLDDSTLQSILSLLPTMHTNKPPLPTRQSTASPRQSTTDHIPVPISTPRLPARRSNGDNPQPTTEKSAPPSYAAATMVEAIYDYNAEDPTTDLSFRKGDKIQVIEHVNDDWWRGTLHDRTGIFPQNHVQQLPAQNESPYQMITPSQPYSYPPPPDMIQHQAASTTTYAYPPPPMAVSTGSSVEGQGKVSNMAKKFGSRVGEAAVFGFGATVGSEAAHAIF